MKIILRLILRPITLVVLLILIGGGAVAYTYNLYQKAKNESRQLASDPNKIREAAKLENERLVEEVGKIVVLPQGETPAIATVTDAGKLKDQPFFSQAKNGFKVLIYTKAKKAYLYDPNLKKVVEIAPINLGDGATTQQGGSTDTTTTQKTNQ